MENIRKSCFIKQLACLIVFSMIAGFFGIMIPPAADAAELVGFTVTGDGVEQTVKFTMDDLKALKQKTYTYSGYNRFPGYRVFEDKTGPTLQSILEAAGLKEDAKLLTFKDAVGSITEFTVEQLLEDKRYYFPNGEEGTENCAPNGNEEGKALVETIIALNQVDGTLMYGQQVPHETTVCHSLMVERMCLGNTIIVSTAEPEQLEAPRAFPFPGSKVAGTEIWLQYQDGTNDKAMIYYTLDGTEPTINSYLYNPSYTCFQPELNGPIVIDEDTTIKTRTLGYGKSDSEVVTYQYTIGSLACRIESPNLNEPAHYTVEALKEERTPVEEQYGCCDEGDPVTLMGKGVLLGTLLDELAASDKWEVEFMTAGGETYTGGTVKEVKDQQCLLAYEVDGEEIADVTGDETVNIQILRHLNDGSEPGNRLKHVQTIKLINVEDELSISSVKLLNDAGEQISAVEAGAGYCIEAQVDNNLHKATKAFLIIQVRNGITATEVSGGNVVECVAVQTVADAAGERIKVEFTLPDDLSGKGYVDVMVWDDCENQYPLGQASHALNFNIIE